MTSQGLRRVCVGQKACPQDISRPKSWFFESDKNDKKHEISPKEDELAKPLMGGSGGV